MFKAPVFLLMALLGLSDAETLTTSLTEERASASTIQKVFPLASNSRAFSYEQPGHRLCMIENSETVASKNDTIVFVHGSPGEWDAWSSYLTNQNLLSRAALIAVDRPGFGGSDPGQPERIVKVQSDRIFEAFRELSRRQARPAKALWVGHSYGGPVVARLAMDHPEAVCGLLLIGASIDPDLEKVEWYQKLAAKPCVSRILPKSIYTANEEILPLKGELQKMISLWREIRCPVTVLHGTKDRLVPFANAGFAKSHLVNAPLREVYLTNVDHFIPWTHRQIVEREVLNLLDR